ncbi:hypothetical protein QUB16_16790 [Microcoleus sp. D3_18a_C4]
MHHYQSAFYEQAFRPVPQENLSFVEQAEKPVLENDARCELKPILQKLSFQQRETKE